MRMLFNTVYYKPAVGGGGPVLSVSSLAEALVRRGHRVTVAASNLDIPGRLDVRCGQDREIDGVQVRYFDAKPTLLQRTRLSAFAKAGVFSLGPEFKRWLYERESHIDVIDSQISFTCSNRVCSLFANSQKKVYFYHQRGNLDPVRLRRGGVKKRMYIFLIEKPVMQRADALIALTRREEDTFRAFKLKRRIEIVPNGIDLERFEKANLDPSLSTVVLLKRLGDASTFLWMSRIHPVKGPEIFVDAFISAAKQSDQIHGVMAGPDEVGIMPKMVRKISEAGLDHRFHYVGLVTGDDKTAILRRADCFVLPTEAEGFSMVLLEALASKCAVLTTKGAYFDEIESAGAGRIVKLDALEVAKGIQEMSVLGRRAMMEMGRRGLELVRRAYSWPCIAEKYEELCREVMMQKHSRNRQ